MFIKAQSRYIHISPRKTRLITKLIQGRSAEEAENQLRVIHKRSALPVLKLLLSAVANAEHNFEIKKENLIVKSVLVNGGPTLQRYRARAYGRAVPIRRRSTHMTMVLISKETTTQKVQKKEIKRAIEKPTLVTSIKEVLRGRDQEQKQEKTTVSKTDEKTKDKDLKAIEVLKKEEKKKGSADTKGFIRRMFSRKSV